MVREEAFVATDVEKRPFRKSKKLGKGNPPPPPTPLAGLGGAEERKGNNPKL